MLIYPRRYELGGVNGISKQVMTDFVPRRILTDFFPFITIVTDFDPFLTDLVPLK